VTTIGSSLSVVAIPSSFAFCCHPEESNDGVRFSIARFSSDESLFVRQFEQHRRSRATPFRGSQLQSLCGNVGFSSGHGFTVPQMPENQSGLNRPRKKSRLFANRLFRVEKE
jgi:hypothetical protein